LLADVGEDAIETLVSCDQLGRGLLAHTGNSRQVVARVSAKCRIRRILVGAHAGLFEDACLVVQGVIGDAPLVVQNPHPGIADQLITVPITRDDDDPKATLHRLVGHRGDDVVGLEPAALDGRDPQHRENLFDDAQLLTKGVGGLLALRLVRRFGPVSECGLGPIECHDHAVGTAILQHGQQHRRETEHRVGHLS